MLAVRLSAAGLASPPRAALAEFEALRTQAEELGNARLRLRAVEGVARAALAAGDPGKAMAAARGGLDLAAGYGAYSGSYRLHRLLAGALDRTGRRAEAADQRRLAGEEIDRLGRDLSPDPRQFFDRLVTAQNGDEPGRTETPVASRTPPPAD
jgi:hypothetical protein